jgi:hypothetical protein
MSAKWHERTEPALLRLAEGESFIGVIAAIDRKPIGTPPQMVCQYTLIEEATGDAWLLNGTYRIDAAIRRNDIGHQIYLRYEGEHAIVGRNGNKMKRFHIRVNPSAAPGWAHDGTQITDADMSF